MDQQTLLMLGLGGLAFIGVIIALFPGFFSSSKADERRNIITTRGARASSDQGRDAASRRKNVVDSLKEIDDRAAAKKPSLEVKIRQAGLDWSKQRYWITAAICGLLLGGGIFIVNGSPLISALALGAGVFGVPNWIIGFARGKRLKKFRHAFPEALDMITRGVKAGLPLGDCLRMIANEAPEPVRSEFKQVIQAQGIGLPLGDAVEAMAQRVPISETSFFAIVIAIQAKAGGNLSEALSNLSKVLRERKKMEGKIKAMSSEAKASAGIIGSLPFAVGGLVYVTSPSYISLLFTTSTGHMVLAGAGLWMSLGIFIIKKMVSFDF